LNTAGLASLHAQTIVAPAQHILPAEVSPNELDLLVIRNYIGRTTPVKFTLEIKFHAKGDQRSIPGDKVLPQDAYTYNPSVATTNVTFYEYQMYDPTFRVFYDKKPNEPGYYRSEPVKPFKITPATFPSQINSYIIAYGNIYAITKLTGPLDKVRVTP
jgi:hypothetical protein